MTLARSWDLQTAVFARLEAALRGEGIDGADVPVFSTPPEAAPRLHARIDSAGVNDRSSKNSAAAEHVVAVHVFERPDGGAAGAVGQKQIKRLLAIVFASLNRWTPLEGATELRFGASSADLSDDGVTAHAWAHFTTIIGE